MTAQGNSQPYVEKMVARILSETHDKEAAKIAAWKKPTDDLRRLVRHDYVRSLRRNLPYREIKTLVAAYSELLPGFNKEIVGMLPTDRLADWATALDLHFNAAPNEGDDGLALRGFYVTRQEGMLKRPLIYVNTAHHPLAVSSTFCHEVGHHLSSEILGESENTPGIGEKPLPLFSEAYALAVAMQKRVADAVFEALDLLADRGLRAMNPFARTREAASIDNRDETAKEIEVKHVIYLHSHSMTVYHLIFKCQRCLV